MTHPAYQLDWNLIRTFTAVSGTGSLTGAASELALTYPTVARHIAQLEDTLQLTLFDRTSSGMVPTAAGIRLAATASDMRAHALAFEAASHSLRTDPGGTVRITLSEFLTPLVPELLRPLRDNFTASNSSIEIVPSATLVNLLEHDADIALRHIRPTQADLVCRRAGSVPLSLWVEPEYLAQQQALTNAPADAVTSDLPTLQYIDGLQHQNLQRGAARLGMPIAAEQVNYQSDCVWSQLHAARSGWGVAVLPDYLGTRYPELQRLPTAKPIPALELWIVARRDMREKPLHRQTFDALADAIRARFGAHDTAHTDTARAIDDDTLKGTATPLINEKGRNKSIERLTQHAGSTG